MKMIPKVIFVLGGPGAGKGTQCQKIVQTYGFKHLSAGDLLRQERTNPASEYGELIESCLKEGTIVPADITCSLLERAMTQAGSNTFLVDGFPRSKDNVMGWNRRIAEKVQLMFVLCFDCDPVECIQRCLGRGESGSGRTDDNLDSVKKRINTYIKETKPIIDYYEKQKLLYKIDACRTEDVVFQDVKNIMDAAGLDA